METLKRKAIKGMKYVAKRFKQFFYEEDGIGVIEMILILVVLIGLIVIFKDQLTALINNVFKNITNQSNSL